MNWVVGIIGQAAPGRDLSCMVKLYFNFVSLIHSLLGLLRQETYIVLHRYFIILDSVSGISTG